jgi:hypothetical protein
MTWKLVRTGTLALLLAGTAIMGVGVPAQAASPPPQTIITTYYSNPQHTQIVGRSWQGSFGCPSGKTGTTSQYVTVVLTDSCVD